MKNATSVGKKSIEVEMLRYRVVTGKHVYGNLDDIKNRPILMDAERIEEIVRKAAGLGNMHIVEMIKHKFTAKGQGVSIIALLEESHFTVHTWPEGDYATVDIYSCSEKSDPMIAFDYVVKNFEPKKCEKFYSDRSK